MSASSGWNGQVGLVGYGEVGRILAEDLRVRGTPVVAFDIHLTAPTSAVSDAMLSTKATIRRRSSKRPVTRSVMFTSLTRGTT